MSSVVHPHQSSDSQQEPLSSSLAASAPPPQPNSPSSRKRKVSAQTSQQQMAQPLIAPAQLIAQSSQFADIAPHPPESSAGPSNIEGPPAKKNRTNKPWTAAEELRLKGMRDQAKSWSEIAKTFPDRTEGSVKKHWYKVRLSHELYHILTVKGYALRRV